MQNNNKKMQVLFTILSALSTCSPWRQINRQPIAKLCELRSRQVDNPGDVSRCIYGHTQQLTAMQQHISCRLQAGETSPKMTQQHYEKHSKIISAHRGVDAAQIGCSIYSTAILKSAFCGVIFLHKKLDF